MCGRYANYHSTDDVVRAFGIDRITETLEPSWNVAPTQRVEMIRDDAVPPLDPPSSPEPGRDPEPLAGPVRELLTARWGLVPPWAPDPSAGPLLINARSETLTTKPAFRRAAVRRRAIVPASGYYEWQTRPSGPKAPYYLAPPGGEPLAFAAVYEWWRPASSMGGGGPADDAGWLASVAIVTRAASDALGHVHDRMPVVVPGGLLDAWLDPAIADRAEVDRLLAAIPDPSLVPREVSRAVNAVAHNGPELVAPVPGEGLGGAERLG
jgi:putative SOS response-associated peptidase YedK